MTNKSNIIWRLGIVLFCLCCVVSAFAQYNQPGFSPRSAAALPATRTEQRLPETKSSPTATPSRGSKLSAKDKAFLLDAGKGGQMEVNWGKLAAQNGQNPDVKKFGNRMITDHSKWNTELMGLAKEEGVTIPTAKSSAKWKSDKDYMNFMVKDHQEDLAAFQSEAQNGSDPDLKKWADKTAKGVKKHLDMAKEAQDKLK